MGREAEGARRGPVNLVSPGPAEGLAVGCCFTRPSHTHRLGICRSLVAMDGHSTPVLPGIEGLEVRLSPAFVSGPQILVWQTHLSCLS